MFMKIFSSVLLICFIAGSALADTYVEYTLDDEWIYEEETPGTLLLSKNPLGGITTTINVPSGIDDGGLTASRHDLPGFSIDNNIYIELAYSSLTFNITGVTAELSLCLELEFFDSEFNSYEIAMAIGQINGSWGFGTWFQDDDNFEYSYDAPIPDGLSINEGALGLYFHGNHVSAYFKDVENNILYPFLDWDISQIVGTYGFRVDNDFEAYTEDGGTVLSSVNLKQVVYGPGSPVQDIKAMPWIPLLLLDTETFALRSSSFSNGAPIPMQYSLQGGNLSPPLSWSNAPANTNSFVLIMDDPDAPGGTWDHWIIYNIPAGTTSLAENAGAFGDGDLPSGAVHGTNSWGNNYYQGPSPPSGTHRYYIKLYALSVSQLNPSGTNKAAIEAAMQGKILKQTQLMGTYTYTP